MRKIRVKGIRKLCDELLAFGRIVPTSQFTDENGSVRNSGYRLRYRQLKKQYSTARGADAGRRVVDNAAAGLRHLSPATAPRVAD